MIFGRPEGRPLRWRIAFALALLLAAVPVLAQPAANYVIGPKDVLQITVFDQPDLSGKYTVDADGTFTFPLIGRIKAAGLTIREFEAELRKRLQDGFFRNPQVTVGVEEYRSQRVFVVGEVKAPGTYALSGDMTLVEVLARAGPLLPTASGEALVVRAKAGKTMDGPILPGEDDVAEVIRVDIKDLQRGSVSRNVDLFDGDTVFVPQAELVYVFGEVKNPGSYPLRSGMTVLQALSLAGGATERAALNRIRIVRIVKGEKKEIRVKLDDVVQPGDTIVVPERYF